VSGRTGLFWRCATCWPGEQKNERRSTIRLSGHERRRVRTACLPISSPWDMACQNICCQVGGAGYKGGGIAGVRDHFWLDVTPRGLGVNFALRRRFGYAGQRQRPLPAPPRHLLPSGCNSPAPATAVLYGRPLRMSAGASHSPCAATCHYCPHSAGPEFGHLGRVCGRWRLRRLSLPSNRRCCLLSG